MLAILINCHRNILHNKAHVMYKLRIFRLLIAVVIISVVVGLAIFYTLTYNADFSISTKKPCVDIIEDNSNHSPSVNVPIISINSESIDSMTVVISLNPVGKFVSESSDISRICNLLNSATLTRITMDELSSYPMFGSQPFDIYIHCRTGETLRIGFVTNGGASSCIVLENPNNTDNESDVIAYKTTINTTEIWNSLDYEVQRWNWMEERLEAIE